MSASANPDIVTDELFGVIDSQATERASLVSAGADYNMDLLGSSTNRVFINDATTVPSQSQDYFGFGADSNTYAKLTNSTLGSYDIDFNTVDGYSVDAWFMRTGYGTWATSGGTYYDGIWNYYWNHYLAFRGQHSTGNKIYGTGLSSYTIDMNRWYNVVMTHDNNIASNMHKVYIDNNLQQTSTVSHPSSARRFYVGNWDAGWSMVGGIGCIRIYKKVLTAAEVTQNYNATKSRFQ